MSDLHAAFEKTAGEAKSLPTRPDNDTLLKLYALYKQGASGDVVGDRPDMFDFVAAAKYKAWESLKGTPSETAMQQYIDLVGSLKT